MDYEHEEEGNDQDLHPKTLTQHSPTIIIDIIYSGIGFISSYGWFILLGSVICLYLWKNYKPKLEEWKESAEHHRNPDKFIAREMSVSAARQKMQEKYDEIARQRAQKLEEERQNAAQAGTAAPTGSSPNQTTAVPTEPNNQTKTCKPRLRPEYNPLMGDTSSCAFRPGGGRRTGGG